MPRRVTVDSSKSVRDSSSEGRRPSVFERLGPGGSTAHGSKQERYRNWEGESNSSSRSYREHYSHAESSDAVDLRHRVESKRAEKERDRGVSRDRSRGDRTPSPSGKRDRSKHRSGHKDWAGSDRKKKGREPSSMVVKGGGHSPDSNHGDGDDWKSYENPATDEDQLSDEYGLELKRQELQRELARMDQIDQGQTGEDSGADYTRRLSSHSPSPVRKRAQHGAKKVKKRDWSSSKVRSRSPPLPPPPARTASPTAEKKGKKKRQEISPGKKEPLPIAKKKKKLTTPPLKKGPRTPSLSPTPKKLKPKDVRKKKGSTALVAKTSKKRVSSSESSSSSSGSDSSSSGSSGSSSSSESEEEYVRKKIPAIAAKKKTAPPAQYRQQHMPSKDIRSPPPKAKPKPSPKLKRHYSPSTPNRSDSSARSQSPRRPSSPRSRHARQEPARRRSPTPDKRAHVKPKQPPLYSRTPSPDARKEKPPPRRDVSSDRGSNQYSSRPPPPTKDLQYYPKRGRSPSLTASHKSFSPARRKRDSLSPRRGDALRGKDQGMPPRSTSGDYRDRDRERDNRSDKYGGKPQLLPSHPVTRDTSASRQVGRSGQGSYDYDRRDPRDSSSGRGEDRPGWHQGRGDIGGRDGGRGPVLDVRGGRGGGGRGGRGGGGGRGEYPDDRDPRYGGYPPQVPQWDTRGEHGRRGDPRGREKGERESRRDEWERHRGVVGPPRGRFDQQPSPRGPADRGMDQMYGKRPADDMRSRSPPGKRRQLTPYQQDLAKGSWQGTQGDGRYPQDYPRGPSPRDHRIEGRDYDNRPNWGERERRDDRKDYDRRDFPRDDRRDFPRDERRDYPREERRDYPRDDRRDYPRDDPRDYQRDDRKDFIREERRDFPREEKRDFPRDDRRDYPRDDRRDYPRNDRRDMLREEERRPREGSSDSRGIGDQLRHRDDQAYGDRRRDPGRADPRGPDLRAIDPRYGDGRGGRREEFEPGRRIYDERIDRENYPDERGPSRGGPVGQDRYGRKRERTDEPPHGQEIGGYKRLREDNRDPKGRQGEGEFRKRTERYGENFSDWSEGGSDDVYKGSPAVRDKGRRGEALDQRTRSQRDSSRESSRDGNNSEKRSFEGDRTSRDIADTRERTRSKEPELVQRESSKSLSSRGNSMDRSEQGASQTGLRSRRSMSRGSTGSRSSSIVSSREKQEETTADALRVQDQRSRASSRESTSRVKCDQTPDTAKEGSLPREESDNSAENVEKLDTEPTSEAELSELPLRESAQSPTDLAEVVVERTPESNPVAEDTQNLASMQDDYEDISDEEFDDAADRPRRGTERTKNGNQSDAKAPAVMDVDWTIMMKDFTEPLKADIPVETSVLKRFSPGQVLARIGVSRALAGSALMEEIEKVCKDELKEEGAPLFQHQTGALNAQARRKWKQRQMLLQDIGPCRRALCARRDMAIRKQLRKAEKDPSEPVFSSGVDIDADLYRLSIQLLRNKPDTNAKSAPQISVPS